MIEVRVGDEHQIDRWKITEPHSRLAQSFQHKKPAGEIGIDHDVLAAYLQEEACVANESHTHLAVGHQNRLVRLSNSRRDRRTPNEPPELPGAFAHRGTVDGLSKHKKL
jgi:hypothetical protein